MNSKKENSLENDFEFRIIEFQFFFFNTEERISPIQTQYIIFQNVISNLLYGLSIIRFCNITNITCHIEDIT